MTAFLMMILEDVPDLMLDQNWLNNEVIFQFVRNISSKKLQPYLKHLCDQFSMDKAIDSITNILTGENQNNMLSLSDNTLSTLSGIVCIRFRRCQFIFMSKRIFFFFLSFLLQAVQPILPSCPTFFLNVGSWQKWLDCLLQCLNTSFHK